MRINRHVFIKPGDNFSVQFVELSRRSRGEGERDAEWNCDGGEVTRSTLRLQYEGTIRLFEFGGFFWYSPLYYCSVWPIKCYQGSKTNNSTCLPVKIYWAKDHVYIKRKVALFWYKLWLKVIYTLGWDRVVIPRLLSWKWANYYYYN